MVVHTWQPEFRWPQKTKFPLMKLPLELREKIYYEVFHLTIERKGLQKSEDPVFESFVQSGTSVHKTNNRWQISNNQLRKLREERKVAGKDDRPYIAALPTRLSLLRVSKQVGAEAAKVLYGDCFLNASIEPHCMNVGLISTEVPLLSFTRSPAMSQLRNVKLSIYHSRLRNLPGGLCVGLGTPVIGCGCDHLLIMWVHSVTSWRLLRPIGRTLPSFCLAFAG